MNEIRRGDIFYIEKHGWQCGSEQYTGRPGVVVSNDVNNRHSSTVEVVYCTTKPKESMPTHVQINSTRNPSTVLCEQISTVSTERIGDYIGRCTEKEMREIDLALAESIGICYAHQNWYSVPAHRKEEDTSDLNDSKDDVPQEDDCMVKVKAERDTYRVMCEKLIDKIIKARVDLSQI